MENPIVLDCNIKYNEVYILPWHLSYEDNPDCLFRCVGGEVVKMEYIAKYNIDIPDDMDALNALSRELWGMDFSIMQSVYAKRRPDLPLKIWYKVKMNLQWK